MAIGWLSALKLIPWSDVIGNAPKVAEGAKKLWSASAKKPPVNTPPAGAAPVDGAGAITAIEVRLSALESAVSSLRAQMLESSELIKALAEQNTQLIARVEKHRVRGLWMTAAIVVLSLVVIGSLVARFNG